MTRLNKNPVYVTEEFKKATIDMIKQVLKSNLVTYRSNSEKYKIVFNVPKTDISADFYDATNVKTVTGYLYIGSDYIRYTGEQAQVLYDAFQERWSEQSKDKIVAAKEAELTAKLQQHIGNTK